MTESCAINRDVQRRAADGDTKTPDARKRIEYDELEIVKDRRG